MKRYIRPLLFLVLVGFFASSFIEKKNGDRHLRDINCIAILELAADVLVVLKSSDMSVDRVDDARKVLSQGDEIEVKLTNVDSKNRHIGVSIKAIAMDEERQAVRDHKKKEDVKSGSATIGDLIKAEMEKGEEGEEG